MSSRRVLLAVSVLFLSVGQSVQGEPPKKPAEKGKPVQAKVGCRAKPAIQFGPVQAVPPEAIARALEQPTNLEFIEQPLSEVVEYIGSTAKIPILMDRKALDDVGVEGKTPITATLKGLKLRSALNHILRQLELTWTIHDEALVITTPEQADSQLQTRVYEVGDLVAARDEQLRPYNDFDQLIDMITSTVKPPSWDTVGGPGSIAGFEAAGITALVVSQTRSVLEEIDRLLADLRKTKKGSAEPPVRARVEAATPDDSGSAPPAAQPAPQQKPP
jgi:hypothetical protein